jgi:hypothetical protein
VPSEGSAPVRFGSPPRFDRDGVFGAGDPARRAISLAALEPDGFSIEARRDAARAKARAVREAREAYERGVNHGPTSDRLRLTKSRRDGVNQGPTHRPGLTPRLTEAAHDGGEAAG